MKTMMMNVHRRCPQMMAASLRQAWKPASMNLMKAKRTRMKRVRMRTKPMKANQLKMMMYPLRTPKKNLMLRMKAKALKATILLTAHPMSTLSMTQVHPAVFKPKV